MRGPDVLVSAEELKELDAMAQESSLEPPRPLRLDPSIVKKLATIGHGDMPMVVTRKSPGKPAVELARYVINRHLKTWRRLWPSPDAGNSHHRVPASPRR